MTPVANTFRICGAGVLLGLALLSVAAPLVAPNAPDTQFDGRGYRASVCVISTDGICPMSTR
jgi:hypothetical protein